MHKIVNANYDGAYTSFRSTQQGCVNWCIMNNPTCSAVDYNLRESSCHPHRAQTGAGHWQRNNCCNRFELICYGTYNRCCIRITARISSAGLALYGIRCRVCLRLLRNTEFLVAVLTSTMTLEPSRPTQVVRLAMWHEATQRHSAVSTHEPNLSIVVIYHKIT